MANPYDPRTLLLERDYGGIDDGLTTETRSVDDSNNWSAGQNPLNNRTRDVSMSHTKIRHYTGDHAGSFCSRRCCPVSFCTGPSTVTAPSSCASSAPIRNQASASASQ